MNVFLTPSFRVSPSLYFMWSGMIGQVVYYDGLLFDVYI